MRVNLSVAECPHNTPVLVGVAAVQQKLEDFKLALEPIALMEQALCNAARDAGSEALLSRADGQLTKAGKFYFEETNRQRPNSSFDPDQPLTRHSNTDYITLRNGTQRAVRTLHPTGSFSVTRLGKLFFRNRIVNM